MTPSRYSGLSRRRSNTASTSRSPIMLPASLIFFISGVSSSELITIGAQVRPRVLAMKGVLVPLPAPGAPPSRMISFGKRRCWRPKCASRSSQIGSKMILASLISSSGEDGDAEADADTDTDTVGGVEAFGISLMSGGAERRGRLLAEATKYDSDRQEITQRGDTLN